MPGRPVFTRRRRADSAEVAAVVVVGVLAAVLVLGGGWIALRPPPSLPPGPWTIGLDMPLSGPAAFRGLPIQNAVKMAIDEVNASGGVGGSQLRLDSRDDAGTPPKSQDPDRGATNANAFVADPRMIAMIGPAASGVAHSEIPITNAAGLLQCSPANSDPGLTKPRDGALDLRSAAPERINYIRTAPADDIQNPAIASFMYNDLGARTALVVDDTGDGRAIADGVDAAFKALGGTVVRRALNPGSDPSSLLDSISASGDAPGAVFFGGFADTGAPELRIAMKDHGLAFGAVRELGRDRRIRGRRWLVRPEGRRGRSRVVSGSRVAAAREGGLR